MVSSSDMSTTSGVSTLVFVLITSLYIVLKQKLGYKYKDPGARKTRAILLGIYILAVVGAQYSFNLKITKELCGSSQTGISFLMTVIPNVFLFGLIIIIFSFFPGWKGPFSNTFGYIGAWLAGARRVFLDLKATADICGNELVQEVYDDPEILINQITPSNFDTFMFELEKNKVIGRNADKYFSTLYKLVTLKDSIAEWMWFVLVGTLVIAISYTGITEISCQRSTTQMMVAHTNWAKEQNKETTEPPPKVYYTRE